MRIFSLTGAGVVQDPRHGGVVAGLDGSFEVAEELGLRLLSFHVAGKPACETDEEHYLRLAAEHVTRLSDPEVVRAHVEEAVRAARPDIAPPAVVPGA